ncbi:hypothetical protein IFM89_027242 [Coptis chinensis]|uniref:phosphatidate cytidylyltransferase n=1 Tax=Coptis chinensis TaxID=261450 RepID=A0A835M569_9MAGN|nr:hypothetical protein IFM89_027242 [Coptis chinensis]
MVVVIQIFMAKELFNLLRKAHDDRQLPGFRLLNWHFFFTAVLLVCGLILSRQHCYFRSILIQACERTYQISNGHLLFLIHCRFLLPSSLIVINDISAYIFGFFFGKTPLIKLSPKKTWEGFIGASFATIISAFVVSQFLLLLLLSCDAKWARMAIYALQ